MNGHKTLKIHYHRRHQPRAVYLTQRILDINNIPLVTEVFSRSKLLSGGIVLVHDEMYEAPIPFNTVFPFYKRRD